MVNAIAESATPDRIAKARVAEVHSERAKIDGFGVGEAHGRKV